MMNSDSLLYYAKEIEKQWKIKENCGKPFMFTSPQLSLRSHLIKWMKNVSQNIKVSFRTLHLAAHILDCFMDRHSISKDRLGFVALVCLMLAAKFEETDSKVPKISELNEYDGNRYSNRDFIRLEVMILSYIDFGLTQPTTALFAEYYATGAILPQDLRSVNVSLQQLQEIAVKVIINFLDASLEDSHFLQFPKSQVAAACILATRRCLSLSPSWTPKLADLTGYFEDNLVGLVTALNQRCRENNTLKKSLVDSPDHGYISDTT